MKLSSLVALCFLLGALVASVASAEDVVQTVRADSTMNGHAGFIIQIVEPSEPVEEIFFFEEDGKYRLYAARFVGSPWELLTPAQYFCPTGVVPLGTTWRFINIQEGEAVATLAAMEQVTVPAGTFSCYRIDVEEIINPGVVVESHWLALGVGFVKQLFYEDEGHATDSLESYSVTGTGFVPHEIGDTWTLDGVFVSSRDVNWGTVKTLFQQE